MTRFTLMRMPEVEKACGLKKSSIYSRIKQGAFPVPVSLGSKHVAWRSDEIEDWMAERPRTRTNKDVLCCEHQKNAGDAR